MPTDIRTLSHTGNSDAAVRAHLAATVAALTACGLVQTNDTGQLDPATATNPNTSNTTLGYMIFRFNDALQATKPVHIRIEFRAITAGTIGSNWYVGLGGTNGAGVLQGTVSAIRNLYGTTGTSSANVLTSGDGSRIAHVYVATTSSDWWGIMVDRLRDSSGAATGEGVAIASWQQTSAVSYLLLTYAGANVAQTAVATSLDMSAAAGQSSGATAIAVSPLFFVVAGRWFMMFAVGYSFTDLPTLVEASLTMFGGVHKVMPIGNRGAQASAITNNKLAMPWE